MISIVDYGAANLLSITRALEAVGATVQITDNPADIAAAEGVVLPGVGAAGAAMARLRSSGLDAALRDVAASGRPLLGLCLGMQLFFDRLAEDDVTGLGLLPGEVPLLPPGQKIPHMGWNTLIWTPDAPGAELFAGLTPRETYAYFVHSYHCAPADPTQIVATTDYGTTICAAVASSRFGATGTADRTTPTLHGLQFHPEKSGAAGLRMLTNWLTLVTAKRMSHVVQPAEATQ